MFIAIRHLLMLALLAPALAAAGEPDVAHTSSEWQICLFHGGTLVHWRARHGAGPKQRCASPRQQWLDLYAGECPPDA